MLEVYHSKCKVISSSLFSKQHDQFCFDIRAQSEFIPCVSCTAFSDASVARASTFLFFWRRKNCRSKQTVQTGRCLARWGLRYHCNHTAVIVPSLLSPTHLDNTSLNQQALLETREQNCVLKKNTDDDLIEQVCILTVITCR